MPSGILCALRWQFSEQKPFCADEDEEDGEEEDDEDEEEEEKILAKVLLPKAIFTSDNKMTS